MNPIITTAAQLKAIQLYFKTNSLPIVSPSLLAPRIFDADQSSNCLLRGGSPNVVRDIMFVLLNKHGYNDPSIDMTTFSEKKTALLQHAVQCKEDDYMWNLIIPELTACM